jgi:hypothetical protein
MGSSSSLGHSSSSLGHSGASAMGHSGASPYGNQRGSGVNPSVAEAGALFEWLTAVTGMHTDSVDDLADGLVLSEAIAKTVPSVKGALRDVQEGHVSAPLRDAGKVRNLQAVATAVQQALTVKMGSVRIAMKLPEPRDADNRDFAYLHALGVGVLVAAMAAGSATGPGAAYVIGDHLAHSMRSGWHGVEALRGLVRRYGNDQIDDLLARGGGRTPGLTASASPSPHGGRAAASPVTPFRPGSSHGATPGGSASLMTGRSDRSAVSHISGLSDSLAFPIVPFDPKDDLSARQGRGSGLAAHLGLTQGGTLGQLHVTIKEGINLVEPRFQAKFLHLRVDLRIGQHSFHSALQPAGPRSRFDEATVFDLSGTVDHVLGVTVYGRTRNHDYVLGAAQIPLAEAIRSRGQEITNEYALTPSDPEMRSGSVALTLTFLHGTSAANAAAGAHSGYAPAGAARGAAGGSHVGAYQQHAGLPASRSVAAAPPAHSGAFAATPSSSSVAGRPHSAGAANAAPVKGVSNAAMHAAAQAPAGTSARVAAAPTLSSKEVEEIRKVFEKFDKDKNGYLDVKELRELCTSLGYYMDKNDKEVSMQEIDTDRNGKIDFQEFCVWWAATEERRHRVKETQKVSTAKVATLKTKAAVTIAKNSYMTWRNLYARMKDGDMAKLSLAFKTGDVDPARKMESEFIFDLDRLQKGEFETAMRQVQGPETPRNVEAFARIQVLMTRASSEGQRQKDFMQLLQHSMDSLEDDLSDVLREIFAEPAAAAGAKVPARARLVKCVAMIAEDRREGDILEIRVFMDKDPLMAFDGLDDLKITLSSPVAINALLTDTRVSLAQVLERLVGMAVIEVLGTRKALMTLSRVFAADEYNTVLAAGVTKLKADIALRRLSEMAADMANDPGASEKERAELAKDLRGSFAAFVRDAEDDLVDDDTYNEYPALAVAAEHLVDIRSIVVYGRTAKVTCSSRGLDLFRIFPERRIDIRKVEQAKAQAVRERAVKDQVKAQDAHKVSPAVAQGAYKPKAAVAAAAPPPPTKPGHSSAGSRQAPPPQQHLQQPARRPGAVSPERNRPADPRYDTHLGGNAGRYDDHRGGAAGAASRPTTPGGSSSRYADDPRSRPTTPGGSRYADDLRAKSPYDDRGRAPASAPASRPTTPGRYEDDHRSSRPTTPGGSRYADDLRAKSPYDDHRGASSASRPTTPGRYEDDHRSSRPTTPGGSRYADDLRAKSPYDDHRGASSSSRPTTPGGRYEEPLRPKSPGRVTYAPDVVAGPGPSRPTSAGPYRAPEPARPAMSSTAPSSAQRPLSASQNSGSAFRGGSSTVPAPGANKYY